MKNVSITIFDGSELVKIAAALIGFEHPVIERGEDAVTTEDDVYNTILQRLVLHGIKCHDCRKFSEKLYNYENEPCKERFECIDSCIVKKIVLHLDRERSTGDDVVCVRVIFRD